MDESAGFRSMQNACGGLTPTCFVLSPGGGEGRSSGGVGVGWRRGERLTEVLREESVGRLI